MGEGGMVAKGVEAKWQCVVSTFYQLRVDLNSLPLSFSHLFIHFYSSFFLSVFRLSL